MCIVFLDIDGVITTIHSEVNEEGIIFDDSCILWLNKLFKKANFQVVISSTWRETYNLSELQKILNQLKVEIIATTPILGDRGFEITSYLQKNPCHNYIVIDDNIEDIKYYVDENYIVHVKDGFYKNGFMEEHFIEAVSILHL